MLPPLIRRSGDIATAICSRSNCAIGFVNQRRVHSLMKGLCRAANSCKAGLVVGVLRIACSGLCTGWSDSTSLKKFLDVFWGAMKGSIAHGHYNRCPTLFESLCSLWPGTGECISPTAIFNDLLFTIVV